MHETPHPPGPDESPPEAASPRGVSGFAIAIGAIVIASVAGIVAILIAARSAPLDEIPKAGAVKSSTSR